MLTLSVVSIVRDAIRGLMLSLCNIVYQLISFFFHVFYQLGSTTIITSDVKAIFSRVGLIIGIFMVFRVTFAFIQYIVNPDVMFDKQKGAANIIKKIIISIVLLGSVQFLFDFAFKVQQQILASNVLEKVILNTDDDDYYNKENFGRKLSATIFTSFYRIRDDAPSEDDADIYNICKDLINGNEAITSLEEEIENNNSFDRAFACLTSKAKYNKSENVEDVLKANDDTSEEYIVNFDGDGILAAIVGLVLLYVGFMFTFQAGIRLIQLLYLEIVAPIPIIMYVTPKGEDNLKKWGTQCLTTFLDFFLRVAIIYFAMFVINIIKNDLVSLFNFGSLYDLYIKCVMIIATLLFVKKVPSLLKEIFPSIGGATALSFDLSKKAFKETMKVGYNATPIGWGLRAGKSIGTAIDRKRYDLPKPRGKFGQAIDKWLPGQAEARKNRVQAQIEANQREDMLKKGAGLNAKYAKADDLVAEFKNREYKESYMNLRKAKKANGEAELELEAVRSNLNTAMASGNREAIEIAKERLKTATDNLHSAQGNLELAKTRHESNKKIYRNDAEIENAYKYYADTHSERKDYDREMPDLGEQSQQEQINETLQEILRRQSGNTTTNESGEEHTDSSQETNDYATTQPDVQARVDNITGVSRDSASSNGAPTEDNSLLVELANQVENVQARVDNITGVSRDSASSKGAPTEDNSLLGELADQVEQERLRNEVLNNLRNDNNGNNNGNR